MWKAKNVMPKQKMVMIRVLQENADMLIEAQVVDPEKEAQDLAEKLGFNQPVAHAVDV